MNKVISALVLAASLAFFGSATAQADHDPNYPATSTGTVSDGTVAPGETFIFSGSGFLPGETIEITVTLDGPAPSAAGVGAAPAGGQAAAAVGGIIPLSQLVFSGTTKADAQGNFSFPITLSQEGVYTLTATGLQSGHTVTAQVIVDGEANGVVGANPAPRDLANTGGSSADLANTGLDSGLLIWGAAGAAALGLGAGGVLLARRRAHAGV